MKDKRWSPVNSREEVNGEVWKNRSSGTPGSLKIANLCVIGTTEGEKEFGAGMK